MSKVSIVPKLDFKGPNVIKGINFHNNNLKEELHNNCN